MSAIKKLTHISRTLWQALSKDIALTVEELRAIVRNQSYASRYPKLFAIFAIIEHEQSPHVFEANHDEFQVIKTDILQNEEVNNHQLLEALRGLFQNSNLLDLQNQIKNDIAQYLYTEASNMVRVSDRYYMPLIKAMLRGFPFLLNHNDYAILKKLLQQKTKTALNIIKYVLENEVGNFFIDKSEAATILLHARDVDNKAAFMLILRFLRRNNLLESFFSSRISLKNKISNEEIIATSGLDYAVVMLSYLEDKYFESKKIQNEAAEFLQIIALNLGVKRSEKRKNFNLFDQAFIRSRRMGYQNKIISEMLEKTTQFSNKDKKIRARKLVKIFGKSFAKGTESKPATHIQPQGFFAVAPLSVEEYWLMKNGII